MAFETSVRQHSCIVDPASFRAVRKCPDDCVFFFVELSTQLQSVASTRYKPSNTHLLVHKESGHKSAPFLEFPPKHHLLMTGKVKMSSLRFGICSRVSLKRAMFSQGSLGLHCGATATPESKLLQFVQLCAVMEHYTIEGRKGHRVANRSISMIPQGSGINQ